MMSAAQQEKLDALRRRFAERLPGMVSEIEDIGLFPERREEAIRRAHTLAGSAGTFGHLELGRIARSIELLLLEGAEPGAVAELLRELRARLP